ncbi:prolyl-tRNA synthetase [Methanobrevibacter arboriphilus JCM 13429 = DSM 1125]|uniref:Proline--tRNA ligase n=1 Tax=Methanobrevibacter arboriphilus JCM 13429 = DSM 1125 TaxID=1300164 RepID=A0A1V6N2V1_METAZ|nr:proline--tRNA ligase [Methanobrevibacter arboriphilus]OQD58999.1 prolyl-tRNA synthetase [Methanobrevibacter arboriphilus JCM 13429 = DSM 1125]
MENFSQWYHNILEEASIIDSRYPIKGMSVWLPKGFKLRKHIIEPLKKLLDKDHEEVLFPLLVPEDELAKEGIHVKGFEDEVYWVTHGGQKELNKKLAIRPTSETAMYPMFSLWVRSHIDLPMKFYQVVNTFRYETKHTRPLIRVREITTFKEAHTVHATKEGADEQVKEAIKIYKEFFDTLAIPYLLSKRPIWDKFPGADYTMAFDTLMPDGKTLQIGTVHNLGQTFAKTFDITYETAESTHDYVYQTCYGLSDRVIASVIGIHGDEKGLRLPPQIAPNQVTIIPIIFKKGGEEVLNKCEEIKSSLESSNIRTSMDNRDIRPGKKFYEWELNGSPIRIELGPRDLENNKAVIVRRDNLEKIEIDLESDYVSKIEEIFQEISENMKNQVWEKMNDSIISTESLNNVNELIKDEKVVSFTWCGDEECGKVIEEITEIDILGTQSEDSDYCKDIDGSKCVHCGKEGKYTALMAKTY